MPLFRWWSRREKKATAAAAVVEPKAQVNGIAPVVLHGDATSSCRFNSVDRRESKSSKHSRRHSSDATTFYEASHCYPSYSFDSIRLVLFRENEYRERRVLFDSEAYCRRRCSEGSNVAKSTTSNIHSAPYRQIQDDVECDDRFRKPLDHDTVKLLGEMIFGTVAMSVKVDTTKLHHFKSSNSLMLSKIFPCIQPEFTKSCGNGNVLNIIRDGLELFESDSDSHSSTVNSLENCFYFRNPCKSIPLEVPDKLRRSPRVCSPNLPGHSSAPFSCRSGADTVGNTPLSSSLKRYHLNQATNFPSGSARRTDDSPDGSHLAVFSCNRLTRLQLGIGVLFSFEQDSSKADGNDYFRRFLLLHMQIVEVELNLLQEAILKTYFSKKVFSVNVWKAWTAFVNAIRVLYETPRFSYPVWLTLMHPESEVQKRQLDEAFLRVFSQLADTCDVRESNFFLSTLLTACLMNHLTWVSSVAPSMLFAEEVPRMSRLPQWRRNTEAAAHPYNQHLAQLLDIWGVVTSPCRIARTLVLGDKRDFVMKILFILSYFIRCSSIEQSPLLANANSECSQLKDILNNGESMFVAVATDSREAEKAVTQSAIGSALHGGQGSADEWEPSVLDATVKRCYSLSQGTTVAGLSRQRRQRHSSDKENLRLERTPSNRVRCRSGSTLSAERLLRMNAASFKLPSSLSSSTQRESTSLCLLRKPSVLSTAEEDAGTVSQSRQLPVRCSPYPSLRSSVIQENSPPDSNIASTNGSPKGYADHGSSNNSMLKSAVTERQSSDNAHVKQGTITYDDVFANSCVEELIERESNSGQAKTSVSGGHAGNRVNDIGTSLIAAYAGEFCPYFALAGMLFTPSVYEKVHDAMKQLASANITSPEPIKEAVCIVANTSDWSVRLISSSANYCFTGEGNCFVPSKLISDMVEQTRFLMKTHLSTEFCMVNLEDHLADVYSKSCALTTLVDDDQNSTLDLLKVANLLGCDLSDIPLLMSVATVHSSETVISLGVI
uniref:UDENN FNIP1/2-type domain-containing protein n=1 Tax=Trichuris muris TaxID=70415 RepID=A0A5S6QZ17_TRIMR